MQDWFELARHGALIITSSERRAREMRVAYSRRISDDADVWASPQIMAFRQWLIDRWSACLPSAQLLNPVQELAAYRYVLESDETSASLVSPMSLVRQLRSADRLVDDYRITLPEPGIEDTDEYAVFHRLRGAYDQLLDRKGWITSSRIAEDLVERWRAGRAEPDPVVGFFGFAELTPQQQYISNALAAHGCDVTVSLIPQPGNSTAATRLTPDSASEVAAVAADVAALLGDDPDAWPRIAIAVPAIAEWRDRLDTVLTERLCPGANRASSAHISKPWSYARGRIMADLPLIQSALDVLSLSSFDNDAALLSRVLLSPNLWDADSRSARALFDLELREVGGPRHAVRRLTQIGKQSDAHGIRRQLAGLVSLVNEAPERALPSEWLDHFSNRLKATRWHLLSSSSSEHRQLLEAWQEVGRELVAMDSQVLRITQRQAWVWLNELLNARDFAPRTGAVEPIRVIEYGDAAGLRFDHAFVVGLSSEALPDSVERNPFLSPDMLDQAGMPTATPERCLAAGRATAAWLGGLATNVTVSAHTYGDRGETVLPSALFDWSAAAQWRPAAPHRQSCLMLPDDDPIPAVADAELQGIRGGVSILEWQARMPYVALLRARLGIRPLPETGTPLSVRVQGTYVHGVLERLWEELRDSDALMSLNTDRTRDLVEEMTWHAAETDGLLPQSIYGAGITSLERRRVSRLCQQWLSVERRRKHPFEVVSRECAIATTIERLPLKLKVDRIDRVWIDGQPRYVTIDYKTGARVSTRGWNPDALTDPQLPIYASSDAMREMGMTQCDGIALAHVAARAPGFKLCSSFAGDLVADKSGSTGAPIYDWSGQLTRWQETLANNAHAFMSGDSPVIREGLDQAAGYEDVAWLMQQREMEHDTE